MRDDLATLVGSRICHDLISPIGAIGNGIELLELTGGEGSSEISLISESVENANARIRFFRLAFGKAGPNQTVSSKDILSILSATARGGRVTYYWQTEDGRQRQDVRIAFLLLLCFESAMPTGGEVRISQTNDEWDIIASSDRLSINEDMWSALTDDNVDVDYTAAQVQFALLPAVMQETDRSLDITLSADQIRVRF